MDLAIDHIPKKGGFIFLVVFFVFEGRREQMVIGGLIIMERGYGGPSVYSKYIVYSFLHLYLFLGLYLCLLFCYNKLIWKISAKGQIRGVRAYYLTSKGSFPLYLCLCLCLCLYLYLCLYLCTCPGNGQRWAYHNGEWSLGDH